MTTVTAPTAHNGIALEHMVEVRNHITEEPSLAKFQFRARSQWVSGARSRTTFDTFTGAGGEHSHRKTFTYDADHPELFQQTDEAITPPEFVLHALASCLTAGIASVAAARGIRLEEATATLEGDTDLQGILGLGGEVRNGYSQVRVRFAVKGDATSEELRKVVERSVQRSAVFDIISNPTDVVVSVDA